jgi:predicted HicB family RNase H-like nuclease
MTAPPTHERVPIDAPLPRREPRRSRPTPTALRLNPEAKAAAMRVAAARGETLTAVIDRALSRYVAANRHHLDD